MLVSVVIPSRNEMFLNKTITDLLQHASGEIEIIAVLDGYWPKPEDMSQDPRVSYIHYSAARGMRNAINAAVDMAAGEYILKCDAHCAFSIGYDTKLTGIYQDGWIIVPRRYALDPFAWKLEDNPKYPIDYMYLSRDLHGIPWDEKNRDQELKGKVVDDLMSAQGSCWFMKKSYYRDLELLDETNYGIFYNEFQEIGLKCWLSGGRVVTYKGVSYAHWHKPKEIGRGYSLSKGEQEKAQAMTEKWRSMAWHKQKYTLDWLVEKFSPVPTWK